MIVEELIKKLQTMPQKATVELAVADGSMPCYARSCGEACFSVEIVDGVVRILAEDEL